MIPSSLGQQFAPSSSAHPGLAAQVGSVVPQQKRSTPKGVAQQSPSMLEQAGVAAQDASLDGGNTEEGGWLDPVGTDVISDSTTGEGDGISGDSTVGREVSSETEVSLGMLLGTCETSRDVGWNEESERDEEGDMLPEETSSEGEEVGTSLSLSSFEEGLELGMSVGSSAMTVSEGLALGIADGSKVVSCAAMLTIMKPLCTKAAARRK